MRLLHVALLQALALAGALRETAEVEACWTTMEAAGWTAADEKAAKEEFRREAQDSDFLARLKSRIVATGTAKSGSSALPAFEHPPPSQLPEAPSHGSGRKTAVFVLGPSAVGKTSMTASLAAKQGEQLGIRFPLITHDGADWRDTSNVWKKFAQDGGSWEDGPAQTRRWVPKRGQDASCHLEDFYDKIFKEAVEKLHHKLVLDLIKQYQYPTVLVPSVANKCFLPQTSLHYCKTMTLIQELKKNGYSPSFLVIHADQAKVRHFGDQRAVQEGKKYNPSSYLGGVLSAAHMYFLNPPEQSWSFFFNAFDHREPQLIGWEDYRTTYAKPLLEQSGPEWCQDNAPCKAALKAVVHALLFLRAPG